MKPVVSQRVSGHRWLLALVTVALTIGTVLLSAGPAQAHNVLVSSDPTANSVLAKAPSTITLVFDQDVQNIYPEMAVTIGSQTPVEFVPTVLGRKVSADLSQEHLVVPAASAGTVSWKIGYRVVSADGHPVTGLVNFSVGTRGPSASPTAPAPARSCGPRWLWLGCAGIFVALVLTAALLLRRRTVPDRLP